MGMDDNNLTDNNNDLSTRDSLEPIYNPEDPDTPADPAAARKAKAASRRDRKKRWKERRAELRKVRKELYQDAPGPVRFFEVYLKDAILTILAIAFILGAAGGMVFGLYTLFTEYFPLFQQVYDMDHLDDPVSYEDILALSPIDEEGAKRIEALGKEKKAGSWTICVYMIGSDLEDHYQDDLSELMQYQAGMRSQELQSEAEEKEYEEMIRFSEELEENGLGLPEYLYKPVTPVASSTPVTDDVIVSDYYGAASTDIDEMMADELSDDISIVIQPGGAKHWSNSLINPNRTQRFLIKNGTFREIENLPAEESSDSETLAGFLKYCKENYPADHTVLVFWDHGGGPFGFGYDSLYGKMLSLKEIRDGLSGAYGENPAEPPLDIIAFDACLMSNLDVVHSLRGFSDYYVLSEEIVPGEGFSYTPWLEALNDDPLLHPAAFAKAGVDSYTDHYMTQNVNDQGSLALNTVDLSVLDAKKAEEAYQAYISLAKAQLIDSAEDIGVLSEIGRCADKSTNFAEDSSDVYNLVDLGNYADFMSDSYPDQCSQIKKSLKEAVLYHRANGNLSDTTGLSVYIPNGIDSALGFHKYLTYINDVCEDENLRALYYYKIAGCLNKDLLESLKKVTDKVPKVMDPELFTAFEQTEPVIDDDGFSMPVSPELQSCIEEYELQLGAYDEESDTITYYGNDAWMRLDGEGNLVCDYDGTWICLDGVPLNVNIVSDTYSSMEYCSKVLYDDEPAYLVFTLDKDSGEYTINGIRRLSVDMMSDSYFVTDLKKKEPVKTGSRITPLYESTDYYYNESYDNNGIEVTMAADTKITSETLSEGYYVCTAVISNQRGEKFYSKVIGLDVDDKGNMAMETDERFIGRDY